MLEIFGFNLNFLHIEFAAEIFLYLPVIRYLVRLPFLILAKVFQKEKGCTISFNCILIITLSILNIHTIKEISQKPRLIPISASSKNFFYELNR